jgi:hypothetical protein
MDVYGKKLIELWENFLLSAFGDFSLDAQMVPQQTPQ